MNPNNNTMTNEEFFALHQPELVVGNAYPTLIFPEEKEEEDVLGDEETSVYAFPPKPEKYKRQCAVDLTGIPRILEWDFDSAVVEEEKEDLSDLPDLISIEECNAECHVSRMRLNQKQSEESYWASLTTIDEIDDAIQKSLSRQYNLVEIIKENKKYEEEERIQKNKDREERNQVINDGEMRRFSIRQDNKEEQERVQALKTESCGVLGH
jgi:hypothetical protein